jgi:DNA-binding MarR family transcriptional regulator
MSHTQFVFEEIKQERTQILIVRSTKLDKMTVSKSLKKLVARGFVKRAEHQEDTRAKSVCLTKKGQAMASKLVLIVEKIVGHQWLKKKIGNSIFNGLTVLRQNIDSQINAIGNKK